MAQDRILIKKVAKGFAILLLVILACRFTKGVASIPLALFACFAALQGRMALALGAFILFPALIIINPNLLPKSAIMGIMLRLTPLAIGFLMTMTASNRPGKHRLPLGLLWLYLFVACFSSAVGYAPYISYLKIINFALLLMGIQFGFRNIHRNPRDLQFLRIFLLSFCALIIFGSILMRILMPGACYLTTMSHYATEGAVATRAAIAELGIAMFAGITNQSQCLAVLGPSCIALLLCDMFFVEKRVSRFHVLSVVCGLPLVYLTSSRAALLMTAVGFAVLYFYCLGRIKVSGRFKRMLRSAMTVGGICLFAVCIVMEVRNQSMTKWIRKTADVGGDSRSLQEAFTESRMSRVDANMYDFRRNRLLGSGFQVSFEMQYWGNSGFILSAPIEKGVLPTMILGETGVLGAIVFSIFLIVFYVTCARKRYFATLTMMTMQLVSNMGEASLFSPGGVGGIMWILCVGGGFCVDMLSITSQPRAVPMPPPGPYAPPPYGVRPNVWRPRP